MTTRKKLLKTYRFTVPVTCVRGYQYFTVKASNEEEALSLFKSGESQFKDEEIEVHDLGEPETIEEVEDE